MVTNGLGVVGVANGGGAFTGFLADLQRVGCSLLLGAQNHACQDLTGQFRSAAVWSYDCWHYGSHTGSECQHARVV